MNKYDKNMAVLKSCLPGFAKWLDTTPARTEFDLAPTPSNHPDLLYTAGPQPRLLYDVDHPQEQASPVVENILAKKPKVILLFGLGLGYLAESLASRLTPGQTMFIVEENPQVIRLALGQVDLCLPMARNTMFFIQPDRPGLERFAKDLAEPYRQGEMAIVVDEKCRGYFSSDFVDSIQRFHLIIRSEAGKRQALFKHGGQAVENELVNLPLTLLARDLGALKGCLAGIPALVISAGPSLAHQVHLLSQAAGKAALIATAPVLRLLLSYDVRPDLVGILDYTADNHTVLRDVYGTEDVPLVFLEGTYPQVIRDYQGDLISALHTHGPIRKWLAPFLGQRGHLATGTNVGAFCLQLAIYLGAAPIILVGQDLAFTDRTSHSEGVVGRRIINHQTGSPDQILVESVDGGQVLSSITMGSYLDEFNQIITLNPGTYINTSPNGARIRGTLEMPLAEALPRFCPGSQSITDLLRQTSTTENNAMSEIGEKLGALEKELQDLDIVAAKAHDFARDIKTLLNRVTTPQDPELLKLLRAHSAYTAGAIDYVRAIGPLRQYLAEPLSNMMENGLHFQHGEDWRETITTHLNRQEELLTAVSQGATRLDAVACQARTELQELAEILSSRNNQASGPDLNRAAMTWTRLGRLHQAWVCRRQALAAQPDSTETALEAARLCLQRERPRLAMEMLRRLAAQTTGSADITCLMKEIDSRTSNWLASAQNSLDHNDWVSALLNARKYLSFEPTNHTALEIEALCLEERRKRIESARAAKGHIPETTSVAIESAEQVLEQADVPAAPLPLTGPLDLNEESALPGSKECRWS